MGYPVMDSIASVVICVCILKAAVDIFRDAMEKMVDKSCDQAMVDAMTRVVMESPGVERIDVIRTRMFGAKAYVDIEIAVDGNMQLKDSHHIAELVHDNVERNFELVKHCMVHVNPIL